MTKVVVHAWDDEFCAPSSDGSSLFTPSWYSDGYVPTLGWSMWDEPTLYGFILPLNTVIDNVVSINFDWINFRPMFNVVAHGRQEIDYHDSTGAVFTTAFLGLSERWTAEQYLSALNYGADAIIWANEAAFERLYFQHNAYTQAGANRPIIDFSRAPEIARYCGFRPHLYELPHKSATGTDRTFAPFAYHTYLPYTEIYMCVNFGEDDKVAFSGGGISRPEGKIFAAIPIDASKYFQNEYQAELHGCSHMVYHNVMGAGLRYHFPEAYKELKSLEISFWAKSFGLWFPVDMNMSDWAIQFDVETETDLRMARAI